MGERANEREEKKGRKTLEFNHIFQMDLGLNLWVFLDVIYTLVQTYTAYMLAAIWRFLVHFVCSDGRLLILRNGSKCHVTRGSNYGEKDTRIESYGEACLRVHPKKKKKKASRTSETTKKRLSKFEI